MTPSPKEKAKELADKFYQTTPNEAWYNPPIGSITSKEYKAWEQAKECALIAVDEVLFSLNAITDKYVELGMRTFWQEVKQELEKL
jgi:hypothetical protein